MRTRSLSTTRVGTQSGFTLLEILIVLGILGGLMAWIITAVMDNAKKAKAAETGTRAAAAQQSFIKYQLDVGRFPETKDGMNALIANPGVPRWAGPYASEDLTVDGWNNPFEYELTSKGPKLISRGEDGEAGTADDLSFVNGRKVDNTGGGDAPAQ
jgi:general secretion pathway protein G